jgi:hypothetical protein
MMGQVPQCTGRLCWEIEVFSNQYSYLFKFYIHL